MGFGERRAREDHFRGYDEGYGDGYAAGFKAGIIGALEPEGTPRLIGFTKEERRLLGRPKKRQKSRRKTAYQSAYSAAYKRLKKKHPRMSFGSLSKKAHAAARKKVK